MDNLKQIKLVQILSHQMCLFTVVILLCFAAELNSLRIINIKVPKSADNGTDVNLSCTYDLEYDKALKYITWSFKPKMDNATFQEIYRYEPEKVPDKQGFPVDGIDVNIDKSEFGKIVLNKIMPLSAGDYKCEIAGAPPSTSVVTEEKTMKVLVPPGNGSNQSATTTSLLIVAMSTTFFAYFRAFSH